MICFDGDAGKILWKRLAVSITGLYPVYYFTSRARVETELLADKFTY